MQKKFRKSMEFYIISMKKGKYLLVFVKVENKYSIIFTENMTKELYVCIMEKYLKEMKPSTGKTLSWNEIMVLKYK